MRHVILLAITTAAVAAAQTPTIFLIGDATVRSGQGPAAVNQWGWGERLADLMDTSSVNMVNLAGGLSNRTFYNSPGWQKTLTTMKPGDFLIIQFGHNDNLGPGGAKSYEASLPGTGEETADWNGATVHSYGWYLRQYIEAARAKGATPIVCSIVPRKEWKDGKSDRSNPIAAWAAQVAQTENAPFVDLQEIEARQYDRLGPINVDPLFADPHLHTSLAGANLNAASLIAGLKGLSWDPVEPYLSAKAAQIPRYRP